MTEQEKKMKKYCNAVERRLNLPREIKNRVMTDFISSITARREAGETDEQIFAELGSPKEAAAALNEQMKEYAYEKSPWRWLWLAVGVLTAAPLLFNITARLEVWYASWMIGVSKLGSIGIIGGSDGPTQIIISETDPTFRYMWLILGGISALCFIGFHRLSRIRKK